MQLANELQAIDTRHLDIAEHEVDTLGAGDAERFAGIRGHCDLMSRSQQNPLEGASIEFFVVDDENGRLR